MAVVKMALYHKPLFSQTSQLSTKITLFAETCFLPKDAFIFSADALKKKKGIKCNTELYVKFKVIVSTATTTWPD